MSAAFPGLPREQWESHKNYPAQVLLMGSHRNFRRINRGLIEDALDGGALSFSERTYRRWIAAMRSHEHYEEHKLYPFLARRYGVPRDGSALAEAINGHDELHGAHDSVIAAFASADRARVVEMLREHERVLNAHLDQEEEMVIPALLTLSAKEFWEYCEGTLPELLQKLEARGL